MRLSSSYVTAIIYSVNLAPDRQLLLLKQLLDINPTLNPNDLTLGLLRSSLYPAFIALVASDISTKSLVSRFEEVIDKQYIDLTFSL